MHTHVYIYIYIYTLLQNDALYFCTITVYISYVISDNTKGIFSLFHIGLFRKNLPYFHIIFLVCKRTSLVSVNPVDFSDESHAIVHSDFFHSN